MPAVREQTAEEPAKLQRVEVAPGVVLKLTAADAAGYRNRQAAEASDRAAWERANAGAPAEAPAEAPASDVVPLTVLTKTELVSLAEARGLATSGSKATIAARFAEGADDGEPDGSDGDDGEPA